MYDTVRIKRNSLFSLLSITIRLVAVVIVFWGLGRFYGPENFGQFTLAHTIASIFIVFGDFGFDLLLTTEVGKNRADAVTIFQKYFSLKIICTSATLVLMWVFTLIMNGTQQAKEILFLFSVYTVATTLTNFYYALYRGFEKIEYETKVSLLNNSLLLFLVLFLIYQKASLLIITTAFVFSRIIGLIRGSQYVHKLMPGVSLKPSLQGLGDSWGKVLIFGTNLIFNFLFFQIDTVLIALFKDESNVGIYQSVIKIIMLPLIIPEILINVLTPILSRLYIEDPFQWNKVSTLMNKLLVFSSAPISIILFIFSEQIIGLIYGLDKYAQAIPVMRVFAFVIFIRFLLETSALMLTTSNRHIIRMKTVIIATFINVALNCLLIPKLGEYGAAITSLVANTFVGLVYFKFTWEQFSKWLLNPRIIIILIVSILIGYVFYSIREVGIFILIPSIIMFFFLYGFFLYFTVSERKIIFASKLRLSELVNQK